MHRFAATTATSPRFRRSACAGLRRAGAMLLVALCKAAVLVATLEASAQVLEPSAGAEPCAKVDLASPLPGAGSRGVSLVQSPLGNARASRGGERRSPRANTFMLARAAGHRLANGLCAPLRC